LEYKIAEQEAPPVCFKSCKQWQDVTKICQKPNFILVMPSLHKEYKVRANWKAISYLLIFVWPRIISIDGKEESQLDATITVY